MAKLANVTYLTAILSLVSIGGGNALAQVTLKATNCPKGCNCGDTLNCFTAAMDMKTGKVVVKGDVNKDNLSTVIDDLQKIQSATVSVR